VTSFLRWVRLAVYFVGLLVVCLYCEVIGRVWCQWLAPRGSRQRARRANLVTRHWHVVLTELTLRVLGCQLDVRGTVPPGRYIVVSNHQSTADIAILPWALRSLNVKFVAKEELGRGIPTVSMALRHWGSALISRHGTRDDLTRMKVMARGLAYWTASVVIFPEGTRSRDGSLLPYKPGAVRIVAKETGLPLLPVAIDGTFVAPDLLEFARSMPGSRGTVTIGTPVTTDKSPDELERAIQEIRAWTLETIEQGRRDGSVIPPAARRRARIGASSRH
jgi:1-acyl-sn-glycerol-3-phosphate acyltransferase